MARQKNIKIQLHERVNSLLAIGESKHEMKKLYREKCEKLGIKWNPAKSPFIHSTDSADAYRQTVNEFSAWLKDNKNEVWSAKDLNNLDKEVAYEYLQMRDETCSAFTVSKDMSALNKVLNLNLNKDEGNLKERFYKDITRSRGVKDHDVKYNPDNYKNQIEIACAFGCRRESILGGDYQVKEMSLFKNGGKVYISLIEKGGRYREAPCLERYQSQIEEKYNLQERESLTKSEFIELYRLDKSNHLFDRYTSKIDNHSLRHEYAKSLYKEIADAKDIVKSNYRSFDKEIVQEIAHALGHNRLAVVINYLR